MEPRIPRSPEDLDAPFLTAALAARHPGVRVAEVRVREIRQVTNAHLYLDLRHDEPAGAPASLFAKLLPLTPERHDQVRRTGMGIREARFYESFGPALPLRIPRVHFATHDEESGEFLLLLEDLDAAGARVSDGTWGIAADSAAAALEDLAALHLRYVDPRRRAAEAGWVARSTLGRTYGTAMLRQGLDRHRDRLSRDFAAIAEIYIERSLELADVWHTEPWTVIHGDAHIGNLFVDGDRVGFLDWGIVCLSTPLRDVSFFLQMAMQPEDRRAHERHLLRHYLERWNASVGPGGPRFDFDQVWRIYRTQAAYTVPSSAQIVTFPPDVTERRRIFANAYLARAEAAIADLEALEALRDLGF
jgi:hypothetical protein